MPPGDAAARRDLERIAAVRQLGHHPETSFEHDQTRLRQYAQSNQMRMVATIVAALMILGVAALGLILAQKGSTPKGNIPTATVPSTAYIASATQEVSTPTRAPISQIAQATSSEASPVILQADVDAQSGSPITTVAPALSAAAAAPNVKDQSPIAISKAMVYEIMRLKDDATGWVHKLQELELDLKLQLDLKKNQDVEVTGRDINECLVVLRAAVARLAPDAKTGVTLRKQEVAVRNLAIRAEVHPDPGIRKTASYFQQKTTELHALNRTRVAALSRGLRCMLIVGTKRRFACRAPNACCWEQSWPSQEIAEISKTIRTGHEPRPTPGAQRIPNLSPRCERRSRAEKMFKFFNPFAVCDRIDRST
jgi:hypothetical protein